MEYRSDRLEEPANPTRKITAYEIGGVCIFLAGAGLILVSPILGLTVMTGSLVSFSRSTALKTEYEEKLKEYNHLKTHPTLDLYAQD